jgi:MFS family permease
MPERTPRNVYAFGLTSFFNDTASEMAYWVLPALLASIGAGPAQLGIIEGIAESVASIAKLLSGRLADRVPRRKPLVVAGYVVANAVKPLLAVTTSWTQILGIRFADRFSKGIRGTARDVMVAESVSGHHIGSAYGLIQSMDSAGAIAGPLLALAILTLYGSMRAVFWAAAIPGTLCVLVALMGIRETSISSHDTSTSKPADSRHRGVPGSEQRSALTATTDLARLDCPEPSTEIPASVGAWLPHLPATFYSVLGAVTLFSLGNSSDMFLVLRAQGGGIPVSQAPLLGLVFNITYTLVSWPAGRLSDRWPRRCVAAAGYGVFAAVYFIFAIAPSRAAIWITMASYGLFYALTSPVLKALVVETVGEDVRGRALGVYFFVTSIATLLASVITGELWKVYGVRLPFFLSAGMAVVAAGWLLLLQPTTKSVP